MSGPMAILTWFLVGGISIALFILADRALTAREVRREREYVARMRRERLVEGRRVR